MIVRVALDEGGLTGAITPDSTFPEGDFRARYFRDDRPQQVEEHVQAILEDLGIERGQLAETALRYVLSCAEVSTVIPGMRSIRNVERNMAVGDGRGLPAETVERLHAHRWERNFYAMSWWRGGTIYQVYPRSFQDGDGDGVGDLPGLRRRLPYLAGLGVDALWLSPFYRSPMADFGYDVADHCDVDPLFGTLDDWDALAADAHELGPAADPRLRPQPHVDRASVVARASRALPVARRRARPPADQLGERVRRLRVDLGRRAAAPGTTTPTCPSSPISTGAIRPCRRRSSTSCASGATRGADGFRIDALRQLVKDDQWRDNPPDPAWREGGEPVRRADPRVHDGPARGARAWSPGCARPSGPSGS